MLWLLELCYVTAQYKVLLVDCTQFFVANTLITSCTLPLSKQLEISTTYKITSSVGLI